MVLDLKKPSDRELLGNLLAGADVLVHNVPPPERAEYGLDNHALSKAYPRLIATGISAFGDFGPYANYRAYDLTAIHSSGLGSLAPLGSPLPEMPPAQAARPAGRVSGRPLRCRGDRGGVVQPDEDRTWPGD